MNKSHLLIFWLLSVFWLVNGCDKATVVEEKENAQKTGTYSLTIRQNLVTLKAENADRGTVLKDLAAKAGIEIALDPRVKDNISISFEALSLEEAFKRITPNSSLVFNKEEGQNEFRIIKVVIPASLGPAERESQPTEAEETDLKTDDIEDQSQDIETGNETESQPKEDKKESPESAEEKSTPQSGYVKDESSQTLN